MKDINRIKENKETSDLSPLLLFIAPLFVYAYLTSESKSGNSKVWLKLRMGKMNEWDLALLVGSINLASLIFGLRMLFQKSYSLALISYLVFLISQYPYSRMFLLHKMNVLVGKIEQGSIHPYLANKVYKARIDFSYLYANKLNSKLAKKGDNPKNFIGSRVVPTTIPIPFFKSVPISDSELVSVVDEERALFPLNQDSPNHHLVLGQSGSGKTTLIKRMIKAALDSDWRVVLIDLKGDSEDAKGFLELVDNPDRRAHFPNRCFNFWNGTKEEIAERVISFFPVDTEPFYLSRNSSAIKAVIERSHFDPPRSVSELIQRLRNPFKYIENPDDVKVFSSKDRGIAIGDLIANDVGTYLDVIRNMELRTFERIEWNQSWQLGVFSLDGFKPTSLKMAEAILNDFASWMFSEGRTKDKKPTLLIVDEASAFSRLPQVPILTSLIERARSGKVSLVYASQNLSAFGSDVKNILHSGSLLWIGASTEVDEIVSTAGTSKVVEAGFQFEQGKFTGISSVRSQEEFSIDPNRVRGLPTFCWIVSSRKFISTIYAPPLR